ncbi:hypothetical protein RUM43_003986 [Polyplax serrata]|uniref:Uncharacterized protein n=1 Tax=Polyplax serrata TaxID=468196 RepID=A0AAN8SAE5_POLSC
MPQRCQSFDKVINSHEKRYVEVMQKNDGAQRCLNCGFREYSEWKTMSNHSRMCPSTISSGEEKEARKLLGNQRVSIGRESEKYEKDFGTDQTTFE